MDDAQATIIVVDDDFQFRSVTARLLAARTGRPIMALGSGQALLRHLNTQNHVNIIFTDINMPDMTGMELLQRVKTLFPEKKCVLMSGDPANEKVALENGADAFIHKPFRIQDITSVLQSLSPRSVRLSTF